MSASDLGMMSAVGGAVGKAGQAYLESQKSDLPQPPPPPKPKKDYSSPLYDSYRYSYGADRPSPVRERQVLRPDSRRAQLLKALRDKRGGLVDPNTGEFNIDSVDDLLLASQVQNTLGTGKLPYGIDPD